MILFIKICWSRI